MKYFLFYDTETTGLPDFRAPSNSEHQPHIVQLAALLVDAATREAIQSLDVIINPDGWEIPEQAASVHGITTEHAKRVGVTEEMAVGLFLQMADRADCRIAHNEPFDQRIIRIAIKRYFPESWADQWRAAETGCTQKLATPILKLPPTEKMIAAGRYHHKSANLSEAYKFFTGEELKGAHRAMVDVEACMAVWWAIQDGVNPNEAPVPTAQGVFY